METYKSMSEKTGIKYNTLRSRARSLKMDKRYQENPSGQNERVFTPEEAERLTEVKDWRSLTSAKNGRSGKK